MYEYYPDYLMHYGVKGMKWGVRRYQNKDGSLTRLGKKHQRRALETIRKDVEFYESYKNDKKNKFEDAKRKNGGTVNTPDEESSVEWYIHACSNLKTSELLEAAYKNGTLRVGQDYITDKKGHITLTESGIQKKERIRDNADSITKETNKKIIEKYIDGPKRERDRISRSFELGDKYGQEIRTKINSTTYATKAEKEKAINDAFTKKLREVNETGDSALYDSVWQQWNFALDDLE